jgi:hypothetical protein
MVIMHGSSVWGNVAILIFLFLLRASAADLSTLEAELRAAVATTIWITHLEMKQAAAVMGIDTSTLGKQLQGVDGYPISLTRLFRLPLTFWLAFTPVLISLVLRKHLAEVGEELTLTRRA